jgi:hypothetical protein
MVWRVDCTVVTSDDVALAMVMVSMRERLADALAMWVPLLMSMRSLVERVIMGKEERTEPSH